MKPFYYTLSNGVKIPALGIGTWQIPPEEVEAPVAAALEIGYRHIDTAAAYGNERGVGRAIAGSGIKREDLFVTTKLMAEIKGYDETLKAFAESLDALRLSYIDLYLIHAPWPWSDMGGDYTEQNIASWRAMEKLYKDGLVRAIGISNFRPEHIRPLLENCEIIPMVNQISYYAGHIQRSVTGFCREHGIFVESYAPLATGAVLKNELIGEIAKKYAVSPAQIGIRYCLQKGTATIPKSTHKERLAQNFEVDFIISDEDMASIDMLDKDE